MGKLMNKTKAQLEEIILRKDSVEKELRDKIEELQNEAAGLQVNVEAYTIDNAALKEHLAQMQNEVELLREQIQDLKESNEEYDKEQEKLVNKTNTLDKALSITRENLKKEYAKNDILSHDMTDINCEVVSLKETLQEVKQQRNSFVVTTLVAVVLIILGAIL